MPDDAIADQPSKRVVEQRIRNRLIEYFAWVASLDEQRRYQAAVPAVSVAAEVFEQWADWNPRPAADAVAPGSVYTPDEAAAMVAYEGVLVRVAGEISDIWAPIEVIQALPGWEDLRLAAAEALEVFGRRGLLPEDVEI